MNYDLIKDRPTNVEAVLTHVKRTIQKEGLKDYIIILGDSVAYSSPGPASASIGYYMNEIAIGENKKMRVFNLAMPSMRVGDIYTMLLKMEQYGISNNNVIINLLYAGFVDRAPYPPPVFWMDYQLKLLDRKTYDTSYLPYSQKEYTVSDEISRYVDHWMYSNIPVLKYKDYIQVFAKDTMKALIHKPDTPEEIGPWYEKPFLRELLSQYEYQRGYSTTPFDISANNPQIDFLNKILERQEGKNTLFFLAAINEPLVEGFFDKEKYNQNVALIGEYFEDKQVNYVNYNGKIPFDLFSDQIHLTPNGYRLLAEELWREISNWDLE